VDRLKEAEAEDPYLLVAYIYHLYAGLLSGGQVLRGKRRLAKKMFGGTSKHPSEDSEEEEEERRSNLGKIKPQPGEAVVHFGGRRIGIIKR